jgi:hypothetical protein
MERIGAMDAIEQSGQATEVEESDFEAFHKAQNITRAQNRFLAAHPEYINDGSNAAKFVQWLTERGIDEPTVDVYEEAYADLASRNELQLNSAPNKGGLAKLRYLKDQLENNMPADQLYAEHQKATEQATVEEAEDRATFEKTEARGAFRWLRQHPDFIQCPENIAAFQLYFNARRIDLNRASVEQIEEAYQALKGQLKLRKIEPAQSGPSQEELENMSWAQLDALRRDKTEDTYRPDPGVRYGIGYTGF